jgi:hypothetical protein
LNSLKSPFLWPFSLIQIQSTVPFSYSLEKNRIGKGEGKERKERRERVEKGPESIERSI